jgi:quinone-modifying oxidoreductase, subunit QmoB
MEKKLGVYICSGCDVDKAIDIEELGKVATNEFGVPVCKSHSYLCGQEGVQLIKDDINNEGVNSIVIAACSDRYQSEKFSFGNDTLLCRAPIREYAAWTMAQRNEEGVVDEDTQMAAEDYVRMYITKVKEMKLTVPYEQETNKDILVVGGGITGLNAALETAKAGYKVNLVEKEAQLGGFALKYKKRLPTEVPYTKLVDNDIAQLVSEVEGHENITVHKSVTVESIAGEPGNFDVKIAGGNAAEFKSGGVVMSTGSNPYDVSKLTELGAGLDNVISSTEFEEMAAKGEIKTKDGKAAKSVIFVQCAGSLDEKHLSYCSGTCCMRSLKQASYVRENDKDAKAYILYKHMRTPGQYEEFYKKLQDDPGVFLTKGDVVGVEASGSGLSVDVDNTLIGDQISIEADLVVLAEGQVPSTVDGDSALNLQYRQGTDLPELAHGYPDSHFVCFPYETRRTGIYAAGTVRQPMDANFAKRDATGAALKAIQVTEQLVAGNRVHPRAYDSTFIGIDFNRCTSCKRCTEECPFGALNENEKGTPEPFPGRCRACGICMGACPERVMSFPDYSVQIITEMMKSIPIPDEYDEKPRVFAFICENDALPALDLLALQKKQLNKYVRIIPLRCLGGTNLIYISDGLSVGIDGMLFLGCKHGDDYQCHYIKGSELCDERLGKVQETIGRLALESERVQQFEISIADSEKLPKLIDDFVAEMDEYGPNPFKGM